MKDELKYVLGESKLAPEADPKDFVIEKRGDVVKFTLREMEQADAINKKNIKELTAKLGYEKAVMTNIEENNKFGQEIKEMANEKRYTVHMYQESFAMAKMISLKLKELEDSVVESELEMAEIKKQIPEVAVVVSPAEYHGPGVVAPAERLPENNQSNMADEEIKDGEMVPGAEHVEEGTPPEGTGEAPAVDEEKAPE